MTGFLLIDKPAGITSFKVVDRVRKIMSVRKAGHCGTLDPIATGLLIVSLGKATTLTQYLSAMKKRYLAEIILGATSTTYDREGELGQPVSLDGLTAEKIADALGGFRGKIKQIAPLFSALKYKGKPLYEYARNAIEVESKTREVEISSLELLNVDLPRITVEVACSPGTYIRSIAHDLGQLLDCGGYVSELRRLSIGKFSVDEAFTLDQLVDMKKRDQHLSAVQPVDQMLGLSPVVLTEERAETVRLGVDIRNGDIESINPDLQALTMVALRNSGGEMIAVGRMLFPAAKIADLNGERVIEYVRVL